MGAVSPVTERSADRAMAAAVQDAGPRGTVLATLPEWYDDPEGKTRDPGTATQVRQDADFVRSGMPRDLAEVLQPGVTTVTTTPLHLIDAGPGRYLQLAFVDTADGAPDVSYTRALRHRLPAAAHGDRPCRSPCPRRRRRPSTCRWATASRPATSTAGPSSSRSAAPSCPTTRATRPGRRPSCSSRPRARPRTSRARPRRPSSRTSRWRTSGWHCPVTHSRRRVVFAPEPAAVTWGRSASLERTIAALQSGAGVGLGETSWDSLLGTVLRDGRAQVSAARGQAQVLLVRAAHLRAARPRAGRTAAGAQTHRVVDRGPGARRLPARHRRGARHRVRAGDRAGGRDGAVVVRLAAGSVDGPGRCPCSWWQR